MLEFKILEELQPDTKILEIYFIFMLVARKLKEVILTPKNY